MDKFSYAIGLGIGQNLSSMGIQGLAVDDLHKQSETYWKAIKRLSAQ